MCMHIVCCTFNIHNLSVSLRKKNGTFHSHLAFLIALSVELNIIRQLQCGCSFLLLFFVFVCIRMQITNSIELECRANVQCSKFQAKHTQRASSNTCEFPLQHIFVFIYKSNQFCAKKNSDMSHVMFMISSSSLM